MSGKVRTDYDQGVVVATIDNPAKLNALSYEVRGQLREVYSKAEVDRSIRVLVLTGLGRTFCAGNDIKSLPFDSEGGRREVADTLALYQEPESMSIPVIAAVNGLALGGGFELALGCDLIVAAESAEFGLPEIRIGGAAGFAMLRLPEVIGKFRAMNLFLSGESVDAQTAEQWGLANEVVRDGKLLDRSVAWAESLCGVAPLATKLYKRVVNGGRAEGELLAWVESNGALFATKDFTEGVSAFIEKRKPVFVGE